MIGTENGGRSAPYYSIVEDYIGVAGRAEGLPQLPDGIFQPEMRLTCVEVLFRERARSRLGRTVTPMRTANLTQSLHGRPPCHYCGPRECVIESRARQVLASN